MPDPRVLVTPPPSPRTTWIAALILAILSGLAMLAVPLAPVTQHTAAYHWDSASGPAALPLSPYRPASLRVGIDCARVGPDGGQVIDTVRGIDPELRRTQLDVVITHGTVASRSHGDQVAWGAAFPCQRLELEFTATAATLRRDGVVVRTEAGDHRPSIDGFSQAGPPTGFTGPVPATGPTADPGSLGQPGTVHTPATVPPPIPGVTADIVADTQWDTSPTLLKVALMVLAYALLAGALGCAVWAGVSARRALPALGTSLPTLDTSLPTLYTSRPALGTDALVGLALLAGIVLGGPTDDDGFITQIMRTAGPSGYFGNYARWANAPEAPFGWPYALYAAWATVSYEPVWLRLPPAVLALTGWVIAHRGLLPRLVGRPAPATRLTLAAAYVGAWLVFGNSLRPEIWFATGLGITLLCVLDALTRRATTPLLFATLTAGLTAGTGPTGVIALAPLALAAPALWRRVVRPLPLRGLPLLGVALACLGVVVPLMFADQSLAAVASANHARTTFGPTFGPLGEGLRYHGLWASYATRQAVVFVGAVALVGLGVLAWRGGLPRARRRVAALVAGSGAALVLVMLVSPTKVPHHFGAALLIGPLALAALVHHLTPRPAIRAPRWLAPLTVGGTLAALGVALHAGNGWWKVSRAGMLADRAALTLGPVPVWPLVVAAGLALAALLTRWRPARLGVAYAVALAVLVAAQYANAAQAAVRRAPDRYTMAGAAGAAVTGNGCLLERALYAEPRPAAGALSPSEGPNPFTPGPADLSFWQPAAGTTESGWYAVPREVSAGIWPLVVGVGGLDDQHRVRAEFDRGSPQELRAGVRTLLDLDVADVRVRPPRGATRFRLVATSEGMSAADPRTGRPREFTVLNPRVPQTIPLRELTRDVTVGVAWNLAFFTPCLRQPTISAGRVEIPAYVLSDSVQPGNMSYAARNGGPFAGVLGLTIGSRIPLYARGDLDEPAMGALDLVRLVPAYGVDLAPVETGDRRISGTAGGPAVP